MRLTLLDIVQRTLSALDSNNVASIGDSVEAEQVCLITHRVLDEINGRRDWSFRKKEGVLTLGTKPNIMTMPEDVLDVEEIYYNNRKITYMYPKDFRYYISKRSLEQDDINNDRIYTNKEPEYYTSYDDTDIVFDSYTGSALVSSKSSIYYVASPSIPWSDTDSPDMPARFHDVVLKGVIGTAMLELKQDGSAQYYLTEYKRGLSRMLKWAKALEEDESKTDGRVDYGRRGALRCR